MKEDRPLIQKRRILVVEDDFLIATAFSRELELAEVTVIGPAPSLERALALVETEGALDGAVLDVNLGREQAFPLADKLRADRVPFVFTTGYEAGAIPEAYADVPRCAKPVIARMVLQALSPGMSAEPRVPEA
jgi:CheY-like chemotaxis protein